MSNNSLNCAILLRIYYNKSRKHYTLGSLYKRNDKHIYILVTNFIFIFIFSLEYVQILEIAYLLYWTALPDKGKHILISHKLEYYRSNNKVILKQNIIV